MGSSPGQLNSHDLLHRKCYDHNNRIITRIKDMRGNLNNLLALVGHRRKHKLLTAGEMRELFQLKGERGRKDIRKRLSP